MFNRLQKELWGVIPEDIGILKVLFPCVAINPEISKGCSIFTGVKGTNTSLIVYLPYTSRDRALNSKEGLYNFLKDELTIPDDYLYLEDEDFFEAIKMLLYFDIVTTKKSDVSIFPIFKNLFSEFVILYKAYKDSNLPYRMIFSSLITLFNKSYVGSSNMYYNKFLAKLQLAMPKIRKSIEKYLWSSKTEVDFLKFLYNVNRSVL